MPHFNGRKRTKNMKPLNDKVPSYKQVLQHDVPGTIDKEKKNIQPQKIFDGYNESKKKSRNKK